MTEHTITDAIRRAGDQLFVELSNAVGDLSPSDEADAMVALSNWEAALAASPAGEVVDHPTFPRGTRVRFKSDTPAAAIIDWLELHEDTLAMSEHTITDAMVDAVYLTIDPAISGWSPAAIRGLAKRSIQSALAASPAGEDRYKIAWQEYDERFRWMQGNGHLSRYLGWHYADVANDLIDRAYPGLREGKAPPTAETPAQDDADRLAERMGARFVKREGSAQDGELVEALITAIIFCDQAAGVGLEVSGIDAGDAWGDVVTALGLDDGIPQPKEVLRARIQAALRNQGGASDGK